MKDHLKSTQKALFDLKRIIEPLEFELKVESEIEN